MRLSMFSAIYGSNKPTPFPSVGTQLQNNNTPPILNPLLGVFLKG